MFRMADISDLKMMGAVALWSAEDAISQRIL